jgi:hypothetical protein
MAEQRLADMLEEHPDAKAELRTLVEEIQEALPAGTLSPIMRGVTRKW